MFNALMFIGLGLIALYFFGDSVPQIKILWIIFANKGNTNAAGSQGQYILLLLGSVCVGLAFLFKFIEDRSVSTSTKGTSAEAPIAKTSNYCSQCQTENTLDSFFCEKCGSRLDE